MVETNQTKGTDIRNMNDIYTKKTRQILYQNFISSHKPSKYSSDLEPIYEMIVNLNYQYDIHLNNLLKKMDSDIYYTYKLPSNYFKEKYNKLIRFCTKAEKEAEIFYSYFDKLTQFPYTKGTVRRTVRNHQHFNSAKKIIEILHSSYHLQLYNCSLDKYLLNEMSDELIDYKINQNIELSGLQDIIAAHLDAHDQSVKNACIKIITGETNTSFLTINIIRGILKSDDSDLHHLLGDLLLAAKLQEGVRQAICENMDCGTIASFRTLFEVIDKNNLLRYSSIRRAVATWIGILDPNSMSRSSDKTFYLMKNVIYDKNTAYPLIKSTDAINILVGLWGLGFYDLWDAVKAIKEITEYGTILQKHVALFYCNDLQAYNIQHFIASRILETSDIDTKLMSGILKAYLPYWESEVKNSVGSLFNPIKETHSVSLSFWFEKKETAQKHLEILFDFSEKMDKKSYTFYPYLFPWYSSEFSYSDILMRMCVLANGLNDENMMDHLAGKIPEIRNSKENRIWALRLLYSNSLTPNRKKCLISLLGNKEAYTRNEAYRIAENVKFSFDDYEEICKWLRFKNSNLRINIISLLKKQNNQGIQNSLDILISDKNEEMKIGGLTILIDLINDNKKSTSANQVINYGKSLARNIKFPSNREKILLNEIFNANQKSRAEEENKQVSIKFAELTCNKENYPIFNISSQRLSELFAKLNNLIEKYEDYEVKTALDGIVLLGNEDQLPRLKLSGTYDEMYPLMSVWKSFYEKEISNQFDLTAMKYSLLSSFSMNSILYNDPASSDYLDFLKKETLVIFGKSIVEHPFPQHRQYLIFSIINILSDIYCSNETQYLIGKRVSEYIYCNIPSEKRYILHTRKSDQKEIAITPFDNKLIHHAIYEILNVPRISDRFTDSFNMLLALEDRFMNLPVKSSSVAENKLLTSLDYILASYYRIIDESQMYHQILHSSSLDNDLETLSQYYRDNLSRKSDNYGINDNNSLKDYVTQAIDNILGVIICTECKRGDSLTPYSTAIPSINKIYGIKHLVNLLGAYENDKFIRSSLSLYFDKGNRRETLSYLIQKCFPLPTDNLEIFTDTMKKASIDDKRLIELAMYAPQWIDFIEKYLKLDGLKCGVYYFIAHMKDDFIGYKVDIVDIIKKFTPLDIEELQNGAFDISWFENAYSTLGEEKFLMLYNTAKYISDGNKHRRAQKYADAASGKLCIQDLENKITRTRNKDSLMSYPLIPLKDKGDMLHRYKFIENFRQESQNFGVLRQRSENIACDMALRNLATRAGFKDTLRLTLEMESEIVKSSQHYFEWKSLDENETEVCIRSINNDKPSIVVCKNGIISTSIPSSLRKHPYMLELKKVNKEFKKQHSRAVSMFEKSMEDKEIYTIEEIFSLSSNQIINPIINNLVFICNESQITGTIRTDSHLGLVNENNAAVNIKSGTKIRIAHPYDLYQLKNWSKWQKLFFDRGIKQPFRQVFRELYTKLDEELDQDRTRMFAGNQIQLNKALEIFKSRQWMADYHDGLEKIFYKENVIASVYALPDWFSPSDIESPIIEYVKFYDRKTFMPLTIRQVPDIVYSEIMRDVDLVISMAHAGSVDPIASHSTIEMRKIIAECNISLFNLNNVSLKGSHAFINGILGEYTIHLGSGIVHMKGVHQINVIPVHSQHRGKIFLPFLDEDPKTAEIISKIILFANDNKIKDPYILDQMK